MKILSKGKLMVCPQCIKTLNYIGRNRCMKCGKSLSASEKEYCQDCSKGHHIFDTGIALWEYDDTIKKSMYEFKYNNQRCFAAFYADELVRRYESVIKGWAVEAIIPVPLYGAKERQRGYNQAALVARELTRSLGIPTDEDCLTRVKKTLPQKELDDKERIINLKNAFQLKRNDVKYKKVILLDDIYTTGATMDACSEVLKQAGVKEIYSVCVCIGKGY